MDVEVELSRIIINETSDQQIIVLKERHGERAFPIVIGIVEIFAIDRRLKGIVPPRPMTHDLLASVIDQPRRQGGAYRDRRLATSHVLRQDLSQGQRKHNCGGFASLRRDCVMRGDQGADFCGRSCF